MEIWLGLICINSISIFIGYDSTVLPKLLRFETLHDIAPTKPGNMSRKTIGKVVNEPTV